MRAGKIACPCADPAAYGGLMLVLAQVFETVENLPGSPVFDRLVLESPWLGSAVVVVVGIVVMAMFRRVGRGSAALAVLGVTVFAGAGVLIAGMTVETRRERIRSATMAVVSAVTSGDEAGVRRWVADELEVVDGERTRSMSVESIVASSRALSTTVESYSLRLRGIEARGDRHAIQRIGVSASAGTGPLPSTWDLGWVELPDGTLKLERLECLVWLGRRANGSVVGRAGSLR